MNPEKVLKIDFLRLLVNSHSNMHHRPRIYLITKKTAEPLECKWYIFLPIMFPFPPWQGLQSGIYPVIFEGTQKKYEGVGEVVQGQLGGMPQAGVVTHKVGGGLLGGWSVGEIPPSRVPTEAAYLISLLVIDSHM